jgi:release factor glutamine methyltransferase
MDIRDLKYYNQLTFFEQSYIIENVLIEHQKFLEMPHDKFSKHIINEIILFNNLSYLRYQDEFVNLLEKISIEYKIQHKPLSKIFKKKYFYGHEFYVNEHVLCPRPETEQLIELVKNHIINPVSILDLGTGSGVIAITLKKLFPKAKITAIDNSDNALEIAKENAAKYNVSIELMKNNWLEDLHCFEVLVSNPPYLTTNEINSVNELKYDPYFALYGGPDGLDFYRKIAEKKYLFQQIFLEINHNHTEYLSHLFKDSTIYRDLNGDNRFLYWQNVYLFDS